ncbi:permease-like cell division protein FtsX [Actinoplanes sp. NPDC049599]|uniref:permease-like cell division protein FtsX n=1 Tax=Actinoplanes sp. NPDC049599 TaxID=3363903 RepID=UPI0037A2F887
MAIVVTLAGAGAAYAAGTRSDPQNHRHSITIMLDPEITAEQQAAVEEQLRGWNPTVGPEFRDAGAVASMAAEMYQDNPEALERAADVALPAIGVVIVESPAFDCEPVPALRRLPGVQSIMIDGVAKPGGRFGRIECP